MNTAFFDFDDVHRLGDNATRSPRHAALLVLAGSSPLLPMMPRFTVDQVRQRLSTSFPTTNAAVQTLEQLGIVAELTGHRKNRNYSHPTYIDLLTR